MKQSDYNCGVVSCAGVLLPTVLNKEENETLVQQVCFKLNT